MARIMVLGSVTRSLVNFRGPLLKAMVQQGHTVIACGSNTSILLENIETTFSAMGVTYHEIPVDRTGMNPLNDVWMFREIRGVFRKTQPDIFVGYNIKPVIYGSLAARVSGVPNRYSFITGLGYAFLGGGVKRRTLNLLIKALYRLSLRANRKVFFQNPDDAALFVTEKLVAESQVVVINGSGVDVERFSPVPLPERLSFLLIARFLEDKGIREYIEAARRIKHRYPEVGFCLVGWFDEHNPAGISEREVQAWVDEGIVEYLGKLQDVRPALANCSVYVLPSYREGTPRTVLEAMAMGRPVITTDVPGCRQTLQDGENGFLVPVKNVPALASVMERFIEHPELITPMGQTGRTIAVEKYDVHKVNAVILDTLDLN